MHHVFTKHPFNAETPHRGVTARRTANEDFFVREHFDRPKIDRKAHRVKIGGRVRRPLELSIEQLSELPQRRVECVLECAGNGRGHMVPVPPGIAWGDGAVGNALWEGPRVADLLEAVDPRSDTREVLFSGADSGVEAGRSMRFERSIPIELATSLSPILALRMNGQPLPISHGGPVRLIVPGWYAVASVKWLTEITAIDEEFAGYFQRETYIWDDGKPIRELRPKCLIERPATRQRSIAGLVSICGHAWGGQGGIAEVVVRVDDGPWTRATLRDGPSPHGWRAWYCALVVMRGKHVVTARARDAQGQWETLDPVRNALGYGYNTAPRVEFVAD